MLWQALPAIKELQTAWEAKWDNDRFSAYQMAINDSLEKLKKYYSQFDEKPMYVIALGMSSFELHLNNLLNPIVLHPYFKLAYIEIAWGGPAEQEAECKARNLSAKDWQDEAQKILEGMVCACSFVDTIYLTHLHISDRVLLQLEEPAEYEPNANSEYFPHQ